MTQYYPFDWLPDDDPPPRPRCRALGTVLCPICGGEARVSAMLVTAIDALPSAERRVIRLARDGHSAISIAERLGISITTVRLTHAAAEKHLQEMADRMLCA